MNRTNLFTKRLSHPQARQGGVIVRTGLRGGMCVDVNDQVKAALQTLTNALGGTTTAVATSITPDNSSPVSS